MWEFSDQLCVLDSWVSLRENKSTSEHLIVVGMLPHTILCSLINYSSGCFSTSIRCKGEGKGNGKVIIIEKNIALSNKIFKIRNIIPILIDEETEAT